MDQNIYCFKVYDEDHFRVVKVSLTRSFADRKKFLIIRADHSDSTFIKIICVLLSKMFQNQLNI